jgi:hypothetical protein
MKQNEAEKSFPSQEGQTVLPEAHESKPQAIG